MFWTTGSRDEIFFEKLPLALFHMDNPTYLSDHKYRKWLLKASTPKYLTQLL
jgi:hypothetical protein